MSGLKREERVRIHRFHDRVAIAFPSIDETVYLDAQDAKALARELSRFTRNIEEGKEQWVSTRIIENGKGVNEVDGKRAHRFV